MKISGLEPGWVTSAVCHLCGEAIPVFAWLGCDRLPEAELALCRECAWSLASGLLLDLADSDIALESLLRRLRLARAACEAARLKTRQSP